MISSWANEVLVGIVSVHLLFLGPKEDGIAHREHGAYRNDLIDTLKRLSHDHTLRKHGIQRKFGHSSPKFGKVTLIV